MLNKDTQKLEKSADYRNWEFGNFQPSPNGIVNYVQDPNPTSKYNVVGDKVQIQRGKNIEEFIENSQSYQAAIVKFFSEKQRQIKNKPATGIIEFQFTDNWPAVATWSKLDNDRNKNKSFFALKESMQPLLPSIKYNLVDPNAPIGITIVNDFHKDLPNHTLYWLIGDKKAESKKLVDEIKADGVIEVKDLGQLTDVTKGDKQLKVWIENANGQKVAENHLCKDHFVPKKEVK
jgi:beta-mannosidase